MPAHTLRYELNGRPQWGLLRDGAVLPIPGDYATTGDFVEAVTADSLSVLDGKPVPLEGLRVLSPVTRNQRFVCQGANYRQHMIESGVNPDDKTFNMIFTKAPSCIVPADSDIVRPPACRLLDYEIELGIVIRRRIDGPVEVTASNLADFVAGICIVNDVSARDIQIPQMQFYKGKSFRTFGPVGPLLCLLGADEMSCLDDLQLRLSVNGEVRQSDTTANLVYKPAETLSELSSVHDFSPGDLLSTGTPAGCALGAPSALVRKIAALLPERTKWELFVKGQLTRPKYLKNGDRIEAGIRSGDGRIDLGVQRNRVVPAS